MNNSDVYRTLERGEQLERVTAWTVEILMDIVEGRRQVWAVRHPLGFICLPVERNGLDGLCIHLWNGEVATSAPTTSQVHSHSWDLWSFVLFGELSNEVIQVADEDVDPMCRVFEVRSHGDVDEIYATPRLVRHSTSTVDVNRAGVSYALPAGAFHATVVPDGQTTATVALGRGRGGGRDLSLGPINGATHRIRRQLCDQQETIWVAKMVADRTMTCGARHDKGR